MASPCCKRAVSIWLKFCRGIPFSATATVVGRKTYHFSFTCGRGQFLQIWKGNLLFFCFVFHHQPVVEVKIGLAAFTSNSSPFTKAAFTLQCACQRVFKCEREIFLPCPKIPQWRMPCTLGKLNISRKKSSTATACSAWVNYEGQGKDVGLRIHVFH